MREPTTCDDSNQHGAKRRRLNEPQVAPGWIANDHTAPGGFSLLPCSEIFDWQGCTESNLSFSPTTAMLDVEVSDAISSVVEIPSDNDFVCYGMICGLRGTYEILGEDRLPDALPVWLESSGRFKSSTMLRGRILEHGEMIQGLMEETSIVLEISCNLDQKHDETKRKIRNCLALACSLDFTLYGPMSIFHDIGTWLQDFDVYLQDPNYCHFDVKYCNPQRLSSGNLSACPMLSHLVSSLVTVKELPAASDYLEILSSQSELEETPQPSAIRSELKRHQKQALTFMLNREGGSQFDRKYDDVWKIVDTASGRMYHNTVSRGYRAVEPPSFFGGIIADPMGLGKTLTMISLVAMDTESGREPNLHGDDAPSDNQDVGATLVIIPPPILGTWEQQIIDHTHPGSLVFRRHHGKTRLFGADDLAVVNVVLTTYHTVAAEWKADGGRRKSPLFSVRWRRIVLDEGHYIRNGNSRMARAVHELDAISRWAVTGTPIQNRLGDLASLLKFVRVYPYSDSRHFESDISGLWKSGQDEEAVRRLKRLSACLLLRRPKSTINLPPRRDEVQMVQLSPQERAAYAKLRLQAIHQITAALGSGSETQSSPRYVNVLQQIESLRLFCNLGLYYETRHDRPSSSRIEADDWSKRAQMAFNLERGVSSITCQQCSMPLGLTDTLLDDTNSTFGTAQYSSCYKFTCNECVDKLTHRGKRITCGHTPSCQTASISTSGTGLEETDSTTSQLQQSALDPPSKIRALVQDIKLYVGEEKCVVFSAWRLTLDHIKASLDHEGIQSIRFDGKVLQKDRQSVVEKFERDSNVRVMLLTLTCGAVGLTLTSASRAYLVEPHWNPTLEEQALARVHRLGQTREVTTVRLCVSDSFEGQVVKVQDHKKQLAGVLLAPHDEIRSDHTSGVLKQLRSLL